MKETIRTYGEATEFLFGRLGVFQRDGGSAYKPGLDTARALDDAFGNPHRRYPTIHIAGTNGKGSTAHTLAAILRCAGYRTGLYTSPHLVDFRERMRIDGEKISREEVVDFVNRFNGMTLGVWPSFFELTMTMAFEYFERGNVDVAVIETGLGGRLDSTNIITPELSIVTNISHDHTAFLGNTLGAIAAEKAGIFKPGVPAIVGEAEGDVRRVFGRRAQQTGSPLLFVRDNPEIVSACGDSPVEYTTRSFGTISAELSGDWQRLNADTVLEAVKALRAAGFRIGDEAVRQGFARVCGLTGLMGRWMKLGDSPLRVCDTGHNTGGWRHLAPRIAAHPGRKRLVLGFVNDKDVSGILAMIKDIPDACCYFTQASVSRALDGRELAAMAASTGIEGEYCGPVAEAYKKALADSGKGDMVFVGGSNFVVADLLAEFGD